MLSDKVKGWMQANGFDPQRTLDGFSAFDLASNIEILRLLRQADKQRHAESEIGC
jgi:hypothetical protein